MIYLDYNATTPVLPEVFEAMKPYFTEKWGNPSSAYRFGSNLRQVIEKARSQVAALIGATADEIIFTGSATEANNTAIHAAIMANPAKRHIITSRVEHSSVLNYCSALERQGFRLTLLPVDSEGLLNLVDLEAAISSDTAVVSLMWANNETGVLFPIDAVAEICTRKSVPFHCDAVQAAGKVPIDLGQVTIDYLAISAHKLYGPKGIGALYVRRGVPFEPLLYGGHQEAERRSGTENVALIAGFGVAAETALKKLGDNARQSRILRGILEEAIQEQSVGAIFYGSRLGRLPNTSNIGFSGIDSDAMVAFLESRGICVSSGSACMSGALGPSHVVLAMTGSQESAKQVIRFSLSHLTTRADIDATVAAVKDGCSLLRF